MNLTDRSAKNLLLLFAMLLAMALMMPTSHAWAEEAPLDYGDTAQWAYYDMGNGESVDLFLIAPTVDTRSPANALDLNEKLRGRFVAALDMEEGIFSESCRIFSPYYRQMSMNAYTLPEEERLAAMRIAYRDISDAFRWYLENENGDRPVILAGFSQGGEMCLELLKEYFGGDENAALRERLVAVYSIGWVVTDQLRESWPQIVPAQGETDTGRVVCFDCEDGSLSGTMIIPEGVRALSINPLNWKTDGTPADRSLNLGAVMGADAEPIPGLCGARIGERGELIVTDISTEDYPPKLDMLPVGSYHVYDYQFFFMNLKENVANRVSAYLSAGGSRDGEPRRDQ